MKRNLLAIGLLTLFFEANAQMTASPKVLSHIDDAGLFYVGKDALVYNGGGLQVKDTGVLENHGNIMIVATDPANDVVRTLVGTGDKAEGATVGGTIVNKLNEEAAYATWNSNNASNVPVYTYGQLYISGIAQNNIVGIVNQEFRSPNHGGYQQFSVPFFGKTAATLSTELGKTFNNTRWSQNEILVWNNSTIVFDNLPALATLKLGSATLPPYSYYILGGTGLDVASAKKTLHGVPVSDATYSTLTLQNAGLGVNYGTNGNAVNQYSEKYNSYLGDSFSKAAGHPAWDGTYFGKNLYFFSNPYLTNLDLMNVNKSTDINYIPNLYGIRLEPTEVQYHQGQGGSIVQYKYVTNAAGVWSGDTDYLMVRPMGTFMIKLNNNTATSPVPSINLANLRRFNYYSRTTGTPYSVTANKGSSIGTVKEIALIGLNANGGEVARTYYVVYPEGATGHSTAVSAQVTAASTNLLGTYEEDAINGGYDNNYTSSYWLYINEANEENFKGKNIKLVKYSGDIVSFKVQVKENGVMIDSGQHLLTTNEGFYFKGPDGIVQPLSQDQIIAAAGNNTQDYDVYYGLPSAILGSSENVPSRTVVVYNPNIDNYIVRFDPNWKKADIQVYDMSGRLLISEKEVSASSDYTIKLLQNLKSTYLVKVKSEKGETVQSKIIK